MRRSHICCLWNHKQPFLPNLAPPLREDWENVVRPSSRGVPKRLAEQSTSGCPQGGLGGLQPDLPTVEPPEVGDRPQSASYFPRPHGFHVMRCQAAVAEVNPMHPSDWRSAFREGVGGAFLMMYSVKEGFSLAIHHDCGSFVVNGFAVMRKGEKLVYLSVSASKSQKESADGIFV